METKLLIVIYDLEDSLRKIWVAIIRFSLLWNFLFINDFLLMGNSSRNEKGSYSLHVTRLNKYRFTFSCNSVLPVNF